MKNKLMYLMLAIFCMTFVACSSSDDDENNEKNVELDESYVPGTWILTHAKGTFTDVDGKVTKVDKDINSSESLDFPTILDGKEVPGEEYGTFDFVFNKDHTLKTVSKDDDGTVDYSPGTWSFKDNKVVWTWNKNKEDRVIVLSADGKTFTFEYVTEDEQGHFFLTYKKTK